MSLDLADTISFHKTWQEVQNLSQEPSSQLKLVFSLEGMRFANYLLTEKFQEIYLLTESQEELDYLCFLLELLEMSSCKEQWLSYLFCRPYQDVNAHSQYDFLLKKPDLDIYKTLKKQLSQKAYGFFQSYLEKHLYGPILMESLSCRRLLPTWPMNEKIPFHKDEKLCLSEEGELEPSTQSFHYGLGWLSHPQGFAYIKALLKEKTIGIQEKIHESQDNCYYLKKGSL